VSRRRRAAAGNSAWATNVNSSAIGAPGVLRSMIVSSHPPGAEYFGLCWPYGWRPAASAACRTGRIIDPPASAWRNSAPPPYLPTASVVSSWFVLINRNDYKDDDDRHKAEAPLKVAGEVSGISVFLNLGSALCTAPLLARATRWPKSMGKQDRGRPWTLLFVPCRDLAPGRRARCS
jgi:hypothetical protein